MGGALYIECLGNHLFPSLGHRDMNIKCTYEIEMKSSSVQMNLAFSWPKVINSGFSIATLLQNGTTMKDVEIDNILLANTLMKTNLLTCLEQNVAVFFYMTLVGVLSC